MSLIKFSEVTFWSVIEKKYVYFITFSTDLHGDPRHIVNQRFMYTNGSQSFDDHRSNRFIIVSHV